MANWDFTIDSDKQVEVSKALYETAGKFDEKKTLFYNQIDGMGDSGAWTGEDYTSFKEGTHGYEGALQDLSDGFRMFGKHFEIMAEGTSTLATDLINIIRNMTGSVSTANSGETSNPYYDASSGPLYSEEPDPDADSSSSPSMSYGAGDEPAAPVSDSNSGSGVWTSYEEAAAAGFANIRTRREFLRGGDDKDKYGTYEEYLKAMYEKYVVNGNQTVPSTTESNVPTSGVTNTSASTNTGVYNVNTKGTSAKDMYNDALNLKDEIYYEQEYLYGYKNNMVYAKTQLDAAYANGTIPESTYNELAEEYDRRIELCDSQIELRSNMYNELYNLTEDRIGLTDGVLKDAQDWDSNDIFTASASLASLNGMSSQIVSLEDIVSETCSDGSTRIGAVASALRNPVYTGLDYGTYNNNLNGVTSYRENYVSNLTWEAARAAAGENVGTHPDYPGVILFNAGNYMSQVPAYNSGGNDYVISEISAFTGDGRAFNGYDSVYDSNTGKYYTYGEYCDYISNKSN